MYLSSFKNLINPYLMVETKKPIILKDGVHYAALENFIAANKAELSSEINAFNRGYVLFTDGITWMFLMMNDNNGKRTILPRLVTPWYF